MTPGRGLDGRTGGLALGLAIGSAVEDRAEAQGSEIPMSVSESWGETDKNGESLTTVSISTPMTGDLH
jgi:hypothetical protein